MTRLIQDAAMQIASHLVNTSEQVTVNLARGGALDEPNKLLEGKLYSRAPEALEVTPPFSTPEEDTYRLYNIGVANEALAYSSEDVSKARTYLQQAAINYGKAIDAKPTEKYFLEPQNRIDTALAHYKALSDDAKSSHTDTAYFTYYLVQALEQQNGAISLTQAFAFVQQHVHSRAQTEAHAEQNPVLSRSQDNTDFSLGSISATQASIDRSQVLTNAE